MDTPVCAQPAAQTQQPAETQPPAVTQAELEQLLAPIALYPDELLTQVLVASTYPLEVVMANRWLAQPGNKDLKGEVLLKALDIQDWDASVKSLVPFPSVLKMMSDQLDWTQKLGDAFLAQQSDVFAGVQVLRGRAQKAGKLQSDAQQTVSHDGSAIVIAPAQPTTVYVPVYNPAVVYGAWPYPSYPPAYYPPPGPTMGSALMTGLAFGTGIAISSALWGWGRPNWRGGNVNVNVNHFNSINSNRYNNFRASSSSLNSNVWQHNANHRRGVAYSNNQVRQQYRPNGGGNAASRDAFRGRSPSSGSGFASSGSRPGGVSKTAARPQNGQRPSAGGANRQGRMPATRQGNSAFQGAGNGAAARAESNQGRASRAAAAHSGGRGGRVAAGEHVNRGRRR